MVKYPESLDKLIESFKKYPGIGPKSAERLAFYTIQKLRKKEVKEFSNNLNNAIENIQQCKICGMLTDRDICEICSDNERQKQLLIVENTKDAMAFEKTNSYNGKYQVLNGVISPLNGIGADDLNLDIILERIKKENFQEVIIATSSTIDGEMTAMYIKKMLENMDAKVYRIGYGLPAGADIEYADDITLMRALESKKEI